MTPNNYRQKLNFTRKKNIFLHPNKFVIAIKMYGNSNEKKFGIYRTSDEKITSYIYLRKYIQKTRSVLLFVELLNRYLGNFQVSITT